MVVSDFDLVKVQKLHSLTSQGQMLKFQPTSKIGFQDILRRDPHQYARLHGIIHHDNIIQISLSINFAFIKFQIPFGLSFLFYNSSNIFLRGTMDMQQTGGKRKKKRTQPQPRTTVRKQSKAMIHESTVSWHFLQKCSKYKKRFQKL